MSWPLVYLIFFNDYRLRKKPCQKALNFSRAYADKYSIEKYVNDPKLQFTYVSGYQQHIEVKLKDDANIKEFLYNLKELKKHIDCSSEELIDIIFGSGRIRTKLSSKTLRNYFFDY